MNVESWLPAGRIRQILAALFYVAIVGALISLAATFVSSLYDARQAVEAGREDLARLKARIARAQGPTSAPAIASAAPMIAGDTITQAAAALQRRIGEATTQAGGALLSIEPQLDESARPADFIGVSAEVDLPQAALPDFVYDLEAGMPYLFIEKFEAELPSSVAVDKAGTLRVTMLVTGRWAGAK